MDGAPEELNFLGNVAVVEVEAGVHAADLRAVQECSGFANGRAAVREAEGDLGDVSLDAVGFEWHVDGSGVDSSTGRHRPISMPRGTSPCLCLRALYYLIIWSVVWRVVRETEVLSSPRRPTPKARRSTSPATMPSGRRAPQGLRQALAITRRARESTERGLLS